MERLAQARLNTRYSWPAVATQTAKVYATASRESRVLARHRPRLAVALGASGGDAGAYGLAAAFARPCAVDAFVGSTSRAYPPRGVEKLRLPSFDLVERARGGYDALVSVLDDRDADVLELVRARGGHIILQNPSLTRLYARWAQGRRDLDQPGLGGVVREMYEDRLPAALGEGVVSPSDADRHGLLMTCEVVAGAQRVIVHSEFARQLVTLDAAASDAEKIVVLPPAFPTVENLAARADELVVARVASGEGATRSLIEALELVAGERQALQVVLVIPDRGRRLRTLVRKLVERSEIRSRVTWTSGADTAIWRPELRRAAAAVQLLNAPELVMPLFLAESLAAGVPTVVSDMGPLSELPDEVLVKLEPGATPEQVAGALLTLVDEQEPAVGVAGAAHARANTVEDLADRVVQLIFA
jgi:glycosyltransferase involved in cell wall biosynthesis